MLQWPFFNSALSLCKAEEGTVPSQTSALQELYLEHRQSGTGSVVIFERAPRRHCLQAQ